jgi:radical SAM enzyme (TIGR01210 family)
MNTSELKRKIGKQVFSLRENTFAHKPVGEPASVSVDNIVEGGVEMTRRRIVLNTHGCSVATCTMCPLPDESVPGNVTVTDQDIIGQVTKAMEGCMEDVVTIYNNGNFFSDREISPFVRNFIFTRVSISGAHELIVESLPQFITEEKMEFAQSLLGSTKLTVAIGLQSWDDTVREVAINSTCTKKAFLSALDILHAHGFNAQVFLMFGAPYLSLQESVCDIVNGVFNINKLGVKSIVISPLRVTKNTLVWNLYSKGKYFPPSQHGLEMLISELYYARRDVKIDNVRIAVSILSGDDGIEAIRVPISDKFMENVKLFNRHDGNYIPIFESKPTSADAITYSTDLLTRISEGTNA